MRKTKSKQKLYICWSTVWRNPPCKSIWLWLRRSN